MKVWKTRTTGISLWTYLNSTTDLFCSYTDDSRSWTHSWVAPAGMMIGGCWICLSCECLEVGILKDGRFFRENQASSKILYSRIAPTSYLAEYRQVDNRSRHVGSTIFSTALHNVPYPFSHRSILNGSPASICASLSRRIDNPAMEQIPFPGRTSSWGRLSPYSRRKLFHLRM